MPDISAVLIKNVDLAKKVSEAILRGLRSISVKFRKNVPEIPEKLMISTLCGALRSFLTAVGPDQESENLGGGKTSINCKAALNFVIERLPHLEGAGCCFERIANLQSTDGNLRKLYYGAFYLKKEPFNIACLVKFALKGALVTALVCDLYTNQAYKIMFSLTNNKFLVEKIIASMARFKRCLLAALSLASPARA